MPSLLWLRGSACAVGWWQWARRLVRCWGGPRVLLRALWHALTVRCGTRSQCTVPSRRLRPARQGPSAAQYMVARSLEEYRLHGVLYFTLARTSAHAWNSVVTSSHYEIIDRSELTEFSC
jgi:hypothetical protein